MILWLNPRAGISGDMVLGALLDLGAPLDDIRDAIAQTGLTRWSLNAKRVQVDAIGAIHAVVDVDDDATERPAAELLTMISRIDDHWIADVAHRAVQEIAEVEARIHGTSPDNVHLHEIGGHDTIIDTVGVAAGLRLLGVERVISEPIAVGTGAVRTAHGLLPAPAPAVAALLAGAIITASPASGETVTPTGAALLRAMEAKYQPFPAATLLRTGYGAGTKRFPGMPNVLQASLLEPTQRLGRGEPMVLLETNLDDISGEVLAHAAARALASGAADAWVTPIIGKKGRPAQTFSVLAHHPDADALERIVLDQTGALGIRRLRVDRTTLERRFTTVDLDGAEVRVKTGPVRSKGEFDDIARISRERSRSFLDVEAEVNERIRTAEQAPARPLSSHDHSEGQHGHCD